ncbi:MAG TPA: GWxTD domain-containing protein [Candidatus Eisenbacteria bacterium]|jgi:GWxTD domain-containing protein|nr:GWxTD domain-containing protein [Candidatus Eisenbacteria bacterium]
MMRGASSCSVRGLVRAAAALVLLAAAIPASAQYPNPGPASQPEGPTPGISMTRPRFSTDATIQPGVNGATEVRIDYRLGRTELLFERSADGYNASYEIRVAFYQKKKLIAGDETVRDLKVTRYAETIQRGEDLLDHVSFKVPPGKYRIRVDLTDLKAERTSSTEFEFQVPDAPAGPLWFTDLSLGMFAVDSLSATHAAALDPNPSRTYGENLSRFAFTGELVDNRPAGVPDSTYRLHYQVVSDLQKAVAQGDTAVVRRGGRTPFLIHMLLGPLDPGNYRVVLDLVSPVPKPPKGKKPVPIRREKNFVVEQTAAAVALDPKTQLEVLRYIATDVELRQMDQLKTVEEKLAFWANFWKERDPSPGTPQNEAQDEFYKRVAYANQHFAAGTQGWRTDMGQIYIKFGQPDEVVRNPFRFDGPPEEIWYYYRARLTYFFVDKDGYGRYVIDDARSSKN